MIKIYKEFSAANGYHLDKQLHLQTRNAELDIIAVGNESNWASLHPLPSDVISVDLVQVVVTNPQEASNYWYKFLLHLVYQSQLTKPLLWIIGLGKIPIKINIEDVAMKQALRKMLSYPLIAKQFFLID